MKNFFKPEDFNDVLITHHRPIPKHAAEIANEKLNNLIESWPVVYGHGWNFESPTPSRYWQWRKDGHTHTARLAFITELPKEPCKHEPMFLNGSAAMVPKCRYCGVELQATWSEVKK